MIGVTKADAQSYYDALINEVNPSKTDHLVELVQKFAGPEIKGLGGGRTKDKLDAVLAKEYVRLACLFYLDFMTWLSAKEPDPPSPAKSLEYVNRFLEKADANVRELDPTIAPDEPEAIRWKTAEYIQSSWYKYMMYDRHLPLLETFLAKNDLWVLHDLMKHPYAVGKRRKPGKPSAEPLNEIVAVSVPEAHKYAREVGRRQAPLIQELRSMMVAGWDRTDRQRYLAGLPFIKKLKAGPR